MISSLQIEGYRGFDTFEMDGLGRVNLLVGTNNSGKTSVLEAVYLLFSAGDPMALWQLLWRRGERLPPTLTAASGPQEVDVSHLFAGHELSPKSTIRISALDRSATRTLELVAAAVSPPSQLTLFWGEPRGDQLFSPVRTSCYGQS
jgi:recombinational DNA repair ATPase RecF